MLYINHMRIDRDLSISKRFIPICFIMYSESDSILKIPIMLKHASVELQSHYPEVLNRTSWCIRNFAVGRFAFVESAIYTSSNSSKFNSSRVSGSKAKL